MTVPDFIGTGWAFPCGITAAGGVRLVSGYAKIDASIRMILSTRIGERVMQPDFGCAIWDHVFDPLDANTIGAVEYAAHEALTMWEPRIELGTVTSAVDPQHGLIEIYVSYRPLASNDFRNLVFPFYITPGEEPEP